MTQLPCPFCGGEVDPTGWLCNDGTRGPECNGCGATATTMEIWNSRPAVAALQAQVKELEARLLTAAGDDLCRLTQEEIKAMGMGAVPIPPKEEFWASCELFHAQVAGEAGVNDNCLTLAQLIAENAKLIATAPDLLAFVIEVANDRDDRASGGLKERARNLLHQLTTGGTT